MGEMHIRINKRALERTVLFLIIVALGALLYLKWDAAPATAQPAVNATALQEENEQLSSQLEQVQAELNETKRELELEREAKQERKAATDNTSDSGSSDDTNSEPELSGELDMSWSVKAGIDSLERVTLSVVNGLEDTQELEYKLYWDNFNENYVYLKEEFVVKSGESWSDIVLNEDSSFPKTYPSGTDTLVLDVRDSDGDLEERFEEQVR